LSTNTRPCPPEINSGDLECAAGPDRARIWPTIEFDSPQRFGVKVLCKSIGRLAFESLRFCAQSGLSCTVARAANVFLSFESEIKEKGMACVYKPSVAHSGAYLSSKTGFDIFLASAES
jgi:hypothetical protein